MTNGRAKAAEQISRRNVIPAKSGDSNSFLKKIVNFVKKTEGNFRCPQSIIKFSETSECGNEFYFTAL